MSRDHESRGVQVAEACCAGKARFESFVHADAAAKRGRRTHDSTQQPYRCRHCHGWHLGQHIGGLGKSPSAAHKRARKAGAE